MLQRLLTSVFSIILFLGCSSPVEKERIAIKGPYYYISIGLYFLDDKTDESFIKKSIDETFRLTFTQVESLPDSITENLVSFKWFNNVKEDFPAPDPDYLSYSKGINENEIADLQNPKSAVALSFIGPNTDAAEMQRKIAEYIERISSRRSCLIMDYTTYEAFNSESWKTLRLKNLQPENTYIPAHITIHTYRDTEYCRAVTLGMEKFGLPDLSIQNISCKNQASFGSLMNAVVQLWYEQDSIYYDSTMLVDINSIKNKLAFESLTSDLLEGAKLKATVKLKDIVPHQGDAANKQFEIVFEDTDYEFAQQEQDAIMTSLFGAEDEDISYISHDEELLRLSEEAKINFEKLRSVFNSGLEPGSVLMVKSPFKTSDGGNEWMWVEVTKWSGEDLKGILQNDPFHIPNLKAGAIVDVKQYEMFDYIYYRADGTTEGNKTTELIMKMEQ